MVNKPIKLDLSNFFNDERRCSLILIDGDWLNIKDVQDHIQNLFHLKDISLLTGDDCYLPPRESIQVLNNADSLKAFKFKVPAEDSSAEVKKSNKKRKIRSPETERELEASTPNLKQKTKRSKCKYSPEKSIRDATSTTLGAPDTSERNDSTVNFSRQTQIEAGEVESTPGKLVKDKKKRSQRQSKQKEETLEAVQENTLEASERLEKTTVETASVAPEVVFCCSLVELDSTTTRKFPLPEQESTVKILENIVIPAPSAEEEREIEPIREAVEAVAAPSPPTPEPDSSQIEREEQQPQPPLPTPTPTPKALAIVSVSAEILDSDSEDDIMVLDDTNVLDSDSEVEAVPAKKDESLEMISELLQNASSLTSLPNIGDTLVFKLPKIKGQASAGHTEFIAGNCSYINRRTKSITVNLISYPTHLRRVLMQFASNLDDPSDLILSVNFKDLIEAKVIVPTVD